MAPFLLRRTAILSTAWTLACGGEAELSQSGPGGVANGGSSGGSSAGKDAGTAGSAFVADSSIESGTSPGGATSTGGASGNAGSSAGAGGSNAMDASPPTTSDPNADRRRTLAERYCTACPKPDCVSSWIGHWFVGSDLCWDELVASVECSMANKCSPIEGGFLDQGPCLEERNALQTCQVSHYVSGTVTGSTTTCDWERSASGTSCHIGCNEDPARAYGTDCSGPPNGPFTCTCQLNGRNLGDALYINATRFFADTCQAAGQQLADGFCHQFINCCYTFRGVYTQGLPEQTLCQCTSDPAAGGFASCEALAASQPSGIVIELCPGYEPVGIVPTP